MKVEICAGIHIFLLLTCFITKLLLLPVDFQVSDEASDQPVQSIEKSGR
jgi:hypothetical protein